MYGNHKRYCLPPTASVILTCVLHCLFSLIVLTPLFGQETVLPRSDGASEPADRRVLSADLEAVIKRLGSGGAGERRAAFKFLVAQGESALELLEDSARNGDTDLAEKCIEAIVLIGRADGSAKAAQQVLGRIANDPDSSVSLLAKKHVGKDELADVDRLIARLQKIGVKLTVGKDGLPMGANVFSDDQLPLLKELPELEYVSLKGQAITDAGIGELIKCKGISKITFNDTSVTEIGLSLLHHLPQLSTISFLRNSFTPEAIESLEKVKRLNEVRWFSSATPEQVRATTNLKQITSLYVGVMDLGPEAIVAFGNLPLLQNLKLSLRHLDDDHIAALRQLDAIIDLMVFEDQLSEEGWENLAKLKLEKLNLYRSSLTDDELPMIGEVTELTRLIISDCEITDEGIHSLSTLHNLTDLRFRRTHVTEAAAEKLKSKIPKLTSLTVETGQPNRMARNSTGPFRVSRRSSGASVSLIGRLNDKSLKQLKEVGKIQSFYVGSNSANDQQLELVATLPIERLNVQSSLITDFGLRPLVENSSIKSLVIHSPRITDVGLSTICQIPSLTNLSIANAAVTDAGVRDLVSRLAEKNQFTSLSLQSCPNLTNESLRDIKRLEELTTLSLEENGQMDGGIFATLGEMPQLRSLHLRQIPVAAFDLVRSGDLNIETLRLEKIELDTGSVEKLVSKLPNLRILHLARTNVTDQDMVAISKLNQLRFLDLQKTRVSVVGLKHVLKIDSLYFVNVDKDFVSEADLKEVSKIRPELRMRRD